MPDVAQALLFVYGECGKSVEEDRFNDWYDNEHAPLRLTVPGFLSASRYQALDAPPKLAPKWLAMYDMTSKDIMQSQPYQDLRFKTSANEKQVVADLEMLNRRVYVLLHSSSSSSNLEHEGGGKDERAARAAKFLYVVHMQVKPGSKNKEQREDSRAAQESHFIQWYASTRIPLLAVVPGYRRSRVYTLTEHVELAGRAAGTANLNAPFRFLAVHEWDAEGADVTGSSEFKMCMTDAEPWKMEGDEAVAEMEDRMFGLYKDFRDQTI
ncbi:hypothetical protein GYMLUDRAFT_35864 [Collybiopsis luxurians FD-317 M1]|nr:hypothetical protein GYMLUDRAFT_35864 [Collybiopsis luxurians FD-317 M1]